MKRLLLFTLCMMIGSTARGQETINRLWKKAQKNMECVSMFLTDANSVFLTIENNSHNNIDFTSEYYRSLGRALTHQSITYNPKNDTLLFIFHYPLFSQIGVTFYSKSTHKKYYYVEDEQELVDMPEELMEEMDIVTEKTQKALYQGDMEKFYKLIIENSNITGASGNIALKIVINNGKIQYPTKSWFYQSY